MTDRGRPLCPKDYRSLAHFRHLIRRFLAFSETAARAVGLRPRQHQMLLAIRGLPEGVPPTVGRLAAQLQLRHHSAVELLNRLSARGLVRRHRLPGDRRCVEAAITPEGERVLRKLSLRHREELRRTAPELLHALSGVLGGAGRAMERTRPNARLGLRASAHHRRRRG